MGEPDLSFKIGLEMVGNVGDVGCRNILPKAFFNVLSVEERERGGGGDEAKLGLRGSLCSNEAEWVLRCEKGMNKALAVAGGEGAVGVRGDQADLS